MIDVDGVLQPWWDAVLAVTGPLALVDAHTHIGRHDPDGFKQEPGELLAHLARVGARAAVFPMHEPGGYPGPNDVALQAATDSGDVLTAFCRVDPRADAVAEATRCLDAGARGIKLHPRAERFTLSEPAVEDLVALAHERRVPVLVHAGRGIPALGRDAVALAAAYPDARLILAHAAISDLSWLWQVLPAHPNVFVDTAWWNPADLMALFALVAPGQIVWASDSPYGLPLTSAVMHVRLGLEAGLGAAAVRSVAGEQMARLLAGEDPVDAGPPPGRAHTVDLLLDRVATHLTNALGRMMVGGDPSEAVALARLACDVPGDVPNAPVFRGVLDLLDVAQPEVGKPPPGVRLGPVGRLLAAALTVARTPAAPLP